MLDAVLTCSDDKKKFAFAVVNKSPDKAVAFSPDFAALGDAVPKSVSATVLSGSSPDDFNDIGAENRVVPEAKTLNVENGKVAIPAHSIVFIAL
jgi:alpha-N-arabinofuranosidase